MAQKEYGVYQEGTDVWVVTTSPLQLGTAENAATYTEVDAMGVAAYLKSTEGIEFRVGRPNDRHG